MSLKVLQRITLFVFAATLAAFVGLKIYTDRMVDRTPPVISFDSDIVEVGMGAAESTLLAGVTAWDDRDGDVTGEIMIKGVSQLITADSAKITYIAFDSSNNMSTASRTVRYTNYEKPRFTLTSPLIFPTGGQVSILEQLSARDVVDGDLSDSIRVTTQNVDLARAGVYSITVQVTNSLGDVESLPLKVVMTDSALGSPQVALSSYIIYREVGQAFNPNNYISVPTSSSAVTIESNVDTSRAGIYEVTYTYQGDTVYQAVVVR